MLILLAIVIVVLLTMALFYLKTKAMTAFGTMMASVFGFALTFGYYEPLAAFLIAKGYGGQWTQAGVFLVLFILSFGIFRVLTDVIWDPQADFGDVANKVSALVCGLLTGLIIAGMALVALAMTPSAAKWPYPRFGDGQTAIRDVRSTKKPPIRADGLVSSLFSWMSKGSLSSRRSFAVYHAGYLDQLHLNKYKAKTGVYRIAGKDAVTVPKRGLRWLDSEGDNTTVVRIVVKRGSLTQGGAGDAKGDVAFMLGQVRLVCKKQGADNTRGAGTAVYPEGRIVPRRSDPEGKGKVLTGVMNGSVLMACTLDEVVTLRNEDFDKTGRATLDLAFQIPSGMAPVLLQFKDNVVISVGGVEPLSEETEAALNAGGGASSGGGTSRPPRPSDPNS